MTMLQTLGSAMLSVLLAFAGLFQRTKMAGASKHSSHSFGVGALAMLS